MYSDESDIAINFLESNLGNAAVVPLLEKLRIYETLPANTPDGIAGRNEIISRMTKQQLQELSQLLRGKPNWIRLALQDSIARVEIAVGVGKGHLEELLRNIHGGYVPPGVVGLNEDPDVAEAKIYSWIIAQTNNDHAKDDAFEKLHDVLSRKKFGANQSTLVTKMFNEISTIHGPLKAFVLAYHAEQISSGSDKDRDSKGHGFAAMNTAFQLQRGLELTGLKSRAPRDFLQHYAEIRTRQPTPSKGNAFFDLDQNDASMQINNLMKQVKASSQPGVRRGVEYGMAVQIASIAARAGAIVPLPHTKLTTAELGIFAANVKVAITGHFKESKREEKLRTGYSRTLNLALDSVMQNQIHDFEQKIILNPPTPSRIKPNMQSDLQEINKPIQGFGPVAIPEPGAGMVAP